MDIPLQAAALRAAFEAVGPPSQNAADDYAIATSLGTGYLARARSGAPTFLVPLTAQPGGVGRSGGGFALKPAFRLSFNHAGRRWDQSAATLECTDEALLDTFLVLVLDLARALKISKVDPTWPNILQWLDEWQTLLGRRGGLTTEQQLGLWGELWLISQAVQPDALVDAWRGPDRDAVDFFFDGVGLEVKVSRRAHIHHVAQRQIDAPVGHHTAYLLSMWIAPEPARGVSLAELVDSILASVSDQARFLRHVALLGYSLADREQYMMRHTLLETPLWFLAADVPRVRNADQGISQIRYVVTLDVDKCVDRSVESNLWRHFCRRATPVISAPSPI